MGNFRKLLTLLLSEWLFVTFFSVLIITLAFIPVIYQSIDTPKDTVFMGTHNNALDYPMFISEIMQSKRGRWTFLATYTSEKQPGTLIHPIYLPFGKIAALLSIEPAVMYHLARVFCGLLLSLSIYYFILNLFPGSKHSGLRKLAFLLTLFSAGFPKIDWTTFTVKNVYLEFWTGSDVFRRASFQPHAMIKNVLLLFILVWMGKLLTAKKPQLKYLWYSLPAGILLGLLDPMNSLTIFALLGVYSLYKVPKLLFNLKKSPLTLTIANINDAPEILKNRQLESAQLQNTREYAKKYLTSYLLFLTSYFIIVIAALFYLNWIFTNTPWKSVRDWEATQFTIVNFFDYANHLGLIFYLGIPGLILLALKKRNIFSYYALILAVAPAFFITSGISPKFHLSLLRFFQTPAYIFLSIGTAFFVFHLKTFLSTLIAKQFNNETMKQFSGIIIYSLLIIIIFLSSLPVLLYSLNFQVYEYKDHYWNIYPEKSYYDSLLWLRNNIPLEAVVLSNPLGGNIIPAVSGNTVYIGHPVSTVNYQAKLLLAQKFLGGGMENKEAEEFLTSYRIDYLFLTWGEQFRIAGKNYPFLEKVMENDTAMIFKVL